MSDTQDKAAVSLGPRIVASGGFDGLYEEGMALIEDVASYLDGAGRVECRDLNRQASFLYSVESMRLTSRLMQLASWLLLQKAVNTGEITPENARVEKSKVPLAEANGERGGPGYEDLPVMLRAFIEQGDRLFERVINLDRLERGKLPERDPGLQNSISDQLARLKAAFGRAD